MNKKYLSLYKLKKKKIVKFKNSVIEIYFYDILIFTFLPKSDKLHSKELQVSKSSNPCHRKPEWPSRTTTLE